MTLLQILGVVAALAVLITVHEYGHYRVAVACGVKVLRFSFGFGRVLWRRQATPDATEFVVSALPLGGYVLMLGDAEKVSPRDAHRTLNGRPLWQRALVVAAGPAANLALAVVLFAAAQMIGLREAAPVLGTPPADSLAAQAGLGAGDRVLAIAPATDEAAGNGGDEVPWRDVRSMNELLDAVASGVLDAHPLRVRARSADGGTFEAVLQLPQVSPRDMEAAITRVGLGTPLAPAVLGVPEAGGPAARAGLRSGDRVLRVDGVPVPDPGALVRAIRASAREGRVAPLHLDVLRDGRAFPVDLTPVLSDDHGTPVARIQVPVGADGSAIEQVLVRDGPIDSLAEGLHRTWSSAAMSLKVLGRMLVGEASVKNLSGPLTIGIVVGKTAGLGLAFYLGTLASVSVGLGVLNLLPVPILDGGTLLYYLFEGVTGRPVSESWSERLRRGGLVILLLLMSLALSNDVARLLGQQ